MSLAALASTHGPRRSLASLGGVDAEALADAMEEVHDNVPKSVIASGKKGKAREAMLRAIAFSKAKARRAKG